MKFDEIQPGEINSLEQYEKALNYIDIHCSKIIESFAIVDKYLYRGIKYTSNPVFLSRSIENRYPKDTSTYLQKFFDNILRYQGFTALRSNSIFCTSDFIQAVEYGPQYYIFPMDGFTYTWSENHKDWIPETRDFLFNKYDINSKIRSFYFEMKDFMSYNNIDDNYLVDKILSFQITSEDLTNGDFDYKVKQAKNIIENCLVLIKENFKEPLPIYINRVIEDVLNFNEDINSVAYEKEFISYHRLTNTNILQALQNEYEIYIHGLYIAIKVDDSSKLLLKNHFGF